MPGRPRRASAAAAAERIQNPDEPHFDGQTESEDSDEFEEAEEEAGPSEPAPLSEYELQRQRNIQSNNEKLEALGLAGGAIAARARAPAPAARPRASPASSSAHSAVATAMQTPQSRKRSRAEDEEQPSRASASPIGPPLNDQQRLLAAALFRGLRGEDMSNVAAEPAPTERVTISALSRTTRELGLELADDDLGDMIAFHDTSGNNSLSFADFLRIVRTVGPGVLDLDSDGSTRRR